MRIFPHLRRLRHPPVIVIMGATGTGKSKLSIDVATRFPAEVVNADKIQVYRGLDITTNKMTPDERRGVPHHLLGSLDPAAELPASGFRSLAASAIRGIVSRGRVPVLAGGSNSFLHALLTERYDSRFDPFGGVELVSRSALRYRCCFIWVDVESMVLEEQLDRRVEEMVGLGMVRELDDYFSAKPAPSHPGLEKAIGVPELKPYLTGNRTVAAYTAAINAIKVNTRMLAAAQVRKIERLGEMGWAMRRLDATEVVRARLSRAGREMEGQAWQRDVAGPAIEGIGRFLASNSTG